MKLSRFMLCAVLIVATVLSACSSPAPPPVAESQSSAASSASSETPVSDGLGPADITFWVLDSAMMGSIEPIWENFNKDYPDINVELVPLPWNESSARLQTAAASDTLPDASTTIAAYTSTLLQLDVVENLNPYFENFSQKDSIMEGLLNYIKQIDGTGENLWYLPTYITSGSIWYRKDWFEEAGLERFVTMDDFFNAIETLTGDGRYGFGFRGGPGNVYTVVPFITIYSDEESIIDENGQCIYSKPIALEAFERFMSIPANDWAPPTSINNSFAELANELANGVTAMYWHHFGSLPMILETLPIEKLGWAPLPVNNAGRRMTGVEPHGLQMYKSSKYKQETFEFISYMLRADQMEYFVANSGGIPANTDTDLSKYPFYSDVMESLMDEYTHYVYKPGEPFYLPEWAAYKDEVMFADIQAIMLGENTCEAVLAKWAKDIQAMQDKYEAENP